MSRTLSGIILLVLACASANAALLSRAGGQAYYDDVLDITWLADANAGAGTIYDDGIPADGLMTWGSAQAWIASLNASNYLGVNNWRLPSIIDTGTPGCNFAYSGTDCGANPDLSTSEMAHLFYSTLDNLAFCSTGGICPQAGWGLTNTGPFSNLQAGRYWSGTTYAPDISRAWDFSFESGSQGWPSKSYHDYAWAVSSGDIAAVPVPGAVWLFGGAIAALGLARRRAGRYSHP